MPVQLWVAAVVEILPADQRPVCWEMAEPLAAEPGWPACDELGVEVGLGWLGSVPAGRQRLPLRGAWSVVGLQAVLVVALQPWLRLPPLRRLQLAVRKIFDRMVSLKNILCTNIFSFILNFYSENGIRINLQLQKAQLSVYTCFCRAAA